MFDTLTLERFTELAQQKKRVAVHRHFLADLLTPIGVYQALVEKGDRAALLESHQSEESRAHYSFIGVNPTMQFQVEAEGTWLIKNGEKEMLQGTPLDLLRSLLKSQETAAEEGIVPFIGGAIGFFSYDAFRLYEVKENELPLISLDFYDTVIAFNHEKHRVTVIRTVEAEGSAQESYRAALQDIDVLMDRIFLSRPLKPYHRIADDSSSLIETDLDDRAYAKLVDIARQKIQHAEVFQLVLSRSYQIPFKAAPFSVYRALRIIHPAPYMFFFDQGAYALAGASPQRLVRVARRKVEAMPIAGTRPRGKKLEEDMHLAQELLADEKESAEHMMLVDLAFNDIAKIAVPNSIQVKELKKVQRFSHAMHLTSHLAGQLQQEKEALDVLLAALPAGIVCGLPKREAVSIIDMLESSPRGLYGGAVCYFDNTGNMDSCVAIRTALMKEGIATIRAGGVISANSQPFGEAEESTQRAQAILQAVQLAEKELSCS